MKLHLRTFEHPERRCPQCGTKLDHMSSLNARAKAEGPDDRDTYTICTDCLSLLKVEERFTLRRLTPTELMELAASPEWEIIKQATAAARQVWAPVRKTKL